MVRSISKGPYIAYHLLNKLKALNDKGKKDTVKTKSSENLIKSIIMRVIICRSYCDLNCNFRFTGLLSIIHLLLKLIQRQTLINQFQMI